MGTEAQSFIALIKYVYALVLRWIAKNLGKVFGKRITYRFLKEIKEDFCVKRKFEEQRAYMDAGELGASSKSGFRGIYLRIKLDNRSNEDIDIEKALLKIFINHVPYKDLFWSKELEELLHDETKEIEFYPESLIKKKAEGCLIIRCFLPPWIDIERTVHVRVLGFLYCKSSFGEFSKEVIAETNFRKDEWR